MLQPDLTSTTLNVLVIAGRQNTTIVANCEHSFSFVVIVCCLLALYADRSRGFGFVIFNNPESLDAVQASRPHEIDGRTVDTKRALPKSVMRYDDFRASRCQLLSAVLVGSHASVAM